HPHFHRRHTTAELRPTDRALLAAGLTLNELAGLGHDQVQLHPGAFVLAVIQVEQFHAVYQADADGGYTTFENRSSRAENALVSSQRVGEGYEGPVNAGSTSAAVGFQDVAVNPECAFAQLFQVGDRAEASADEPLDLDRPTVDLAASVTLLAGVSAAGEHPVFRGQPALAAADEERRHVQLDRAGTQDRRPPHADEDAAWCLAGVTPAECKGAEFVGSSAVGAHGAFLRRVNLVCRTDFNPFLPANGLKSVLRDR